jgi:hypothetical protein
MPFTLHPYHRVPTQYFTSTLRMLRIAIVTTICFLFGSSLVNADEPLTSRDRKSFKTVPFNPAPSEAQRHELERAIALCVKTVEREVPGNHFEAIADSGLVNIAGIDRGRFTFWKCMSENGHQLAPNNK